MSEQFCRIDYGAVPPQERPGMRHRVKNLSVLVPLEVDQGFISRAIIAALERAEDERHNPARLPEPPNDLPPQASGFMLTGMQGHPRMAIYEISDAVLAALGIGGDDG